VGGGSVQMSTGSSARLTEVFGGSPQSLGAIVRIVPLLLKSDSEFDISSSVNY